MTVRIGGRLVVPGSWGRKERKGKGSGQFESSEGRRRASCLPRTARLESGGFWFLGTEWMALVPPSYAEAASSHHPRAREEDAIRAVGRAVGCCLSPCLSSNDSPCPPERSARKVKRLTSLLECTLLLVLCDRRRRRRLGAR